MPDRYLAHVPHADRHTLVGAHDNVTDVVCVAHKSNAAHVVELAALRIETAARIGIIGCQSRRHLWHRQVIAIDPRRIEQDLVLHHRPAKPRVVGNPMDRAVRPFNNPIFDRLQLLRAAVRTFENVPIHQAARTKQRSHCRSHTGWESGLCQPLKYDLPCEIVVGAFFEGQNEIGKSVQRDGTHHHHVRDAIHLKFERKCDQSFNLFGRMVRPLRNDLNLWRREVRVSIHRHPLKRQDPSDRDKGGQHQDQKSLTQGRLDDSMDHSDGVVAVLICFRKISSGGRCLQRCSEFANCRNRLPLPITLSPGFRPLVTSVWPFRLSPSVTGRRPNWFWETSAYTKGWFSLSRSTAASGNAMALRIVPAFTVATTNISFFSFPPGLLVSMRACSVRVFGSSEAAT